MQLTKRPLCSSEASVGRMLLLDVLNPHLCKVMQYESAAGSEQHVAVLFL